MGIGDVLLDVVLKLLHKVDRLLSVGVVPTVVSGRPWLA